MDFNVVVIAGRLAAVPEVRSFESGVRLVRYLVATRSYAPRRRVDVVPVTLWDPHENLLADEAVAGRGVWIVGSVQRRFWAGGDGRRSRLEVVAHQVQLRDRDVATEPG